MELTELLKLKYTDLEKKTNSELFKIINLSADYAENFKNKTIEYLTKFNDTYELLKTPEEELTTELLNKAELLSEEVKNSHVKSMEYTKKMEEIEQIYASALDILNFRINGKTNK